MAAPDSEEVTRLLAEWENGNSAARDELISLVYNELRRIARNYRRRERPGQTLQTTEIVHEAYIRLARNSRNNGAPFFAVAARAMRQLLVDRARNRNRKKRGGGAIHVSLDEAVAIGNDRDVDLLKLDEALKELSLHAPRQSKIVELRYFGGLTIEQTANVLELSVRTANREWERARTWLAILMQEK